MAYEDDLDVIVFCLQEADHPEVERPGNVLLELAHAARYVHHCNHHRIPLVLELLFPGLIAEIFLLERANAGAARLSSLPLYVLDQATALVQVRKNSRFSDLGEFGGGRLDRLLRFIFQIGKVQVFENEFGDLVDFNFGFVVVLARTIPGAGSDAGILAGLALTCDYIANLGASISGAPLLLLAIVEAKLVFIERADRDFHYALAVGKNDRFIGNNGTEILFYRIADSLFVTFLIYLTLARKRPVVPL